MLLKKEKEVLEYFADHEVEHTARRFNFSQEILFTEQELKKEKLNLRGILC
ncbi:MAG: hypothetical protein Q8O02_04400 [Candidatus Omnitrophota bacterium]|nr:hypothetical protein [Candidatus Omnitrophota bacterium]